MPNPGLPSQQLGALHPGHPIFTPAARIAKQDLHQKRPVPGPYAYAPATTACGQHVDSQPREQPWKAERLRPDAPKEGTRLPPQRSPPATPTAHNASSQDGAP